MRKLALGLAAAAATCVAAPASAAVFIGTTSGCFGAACAPAATATYGGLTFNTGGFNQSDAGGFLAIGSGFPPTDTLGLFTLTGLPFNYNSPPTLFTLLVNFTSPGSASGSYLASITGTVAGDGVGGVFVDFNNTPQLFTTTGGSFTLMVNDLGVSASGVATPITGIIRAVPEPATWGMMLLGFAGMGLVIRRRRSPALAQLA